MKKTKHFIGLGVVLLSISLLVACGSQSSKTASTSNDEKTVATSNSSKETITFDTPIVTDCKRRCDLINAYLCRLYRSL